MSIFRGLIFWQSSTFWRVSIKYSDYYKAGNKVDKVEAEILEQYPDLVNLMEEYQNAQMQQIEFGGFHEFSVGVLVGAQLILEMLIDL